MQKMIERKQITPLSIKLELICSVLDHMCITPLRQSNLHIH